MDWLVISGIIFAISVLAGIMKIIEINRRSARANSSLDEAELLRRELEVLKSDFVKTSEIENQRLNNFGRTLEQDEAKLTEDRAKLKDKEEKLDEIWHERFKQYPSSAIAWGCQSAGVLQLLHSKYLTRYQGGPSAERIKGLINEVGAAEQTAKSLEIKLEAIYATFPQVRLYDENPSGAFSELREGPEVKSFRSAVDEIAWQNFDKITDALHELRDRIDQYKANNYASIRQRELEDTDFQRRKRLLQQTYSDKENELQAKVERESKELEMKALGLKEYEETLDALLSERESNYPSLGKAYAELVTINDNKRIAELTNKVPPALKAAEALKEIKGEKRHLAEQLKNLEYFHATFLDLFPEAEDLLESGIEDETEGDEIAITEGADGKMDRASYWIDEEEYQRLAPAERDQLALERWQKRRKSKWEIGREYERYVGHLYELEDYKVDYYGAVMGKSDLGRDIIATSPNGEVLIIQAKYWSRQKTIHEKHILQTFGTAIEHAVKQAKKDETIELRNYKGMFNLGMVVPVIFTSTKLSDIAKDMASTLNVMVKEEQAMGEWPQIKCNIGRDGEKIYHLPFDQQYDKIKIEQNKGECFVHSVDEAIETGFRRAKRHFVGS